MIIGTIRTTSANNTYLRTRRCGKPQRPRFPTAPTAHSSFLEYFQLNGTLLAWLHARNRELVRGDDALNDPLVSSLPAFNVESIPRYAARLAGDQ